MIHFWHFWKNKSPQCLINNLGLAEKQPKKTTHTQSCDGWPPQKKKKKDFTDYHLNDRLKLQSKEKKNEKKRRNDPSKVSHCLHDCVENCPSVMWYIWRIRKIKTWKMNSVWWRITDVMGRGRFWPRDTLSMKMDKARRTEDQHSEGKVSID